MSRPLQVYLDSSDFSVLSDPKQRTTELVKIEEQLLSWQEQGLIEIRFSYAHVIEGAPINPENTEIASIRLSHIKRICNLKCLADPITIMETEVRSVCNGSVQDIPGGIYRNNGDWFPTIDEFKDVSTPEDIYREQIALLPDRKKRRSAEQLYFDKHGRLNQKTKKQLKKTAPSIIQEIASKYPLSLEASKICYEAIIGNGSSEKIWEAIKCSLADLDCVGPWYEKQWDQISPLSSHLREIGTDLKTSLSKAAEDMRTLHLEMQRLGYSDKELSNNTQTMFKSLLLSMPLNIAKTLAGKLQISNSNELTIDWELAPSLLTSVTIAAHVGRKTAMLPVSKREAKVSDFGDIIHTLNLPYVDVFRADGFISSAINDAKIPLDTTIVSKLVYLPDAIQDKLNTKKVT